MINIENLLDGIVAALRDIPALVTLLGNANKISAYKDDYPTATSLYKATFAMEPGTMLVAWKATGPGVRNEGYWRHRVSIFIQPAKAVSPMDVVRTALDGVVTSSGLKFILTVVDGNGECFTPVDVSQIARVTNPEKLDNFEITLFYSEIGMT